MRNRILTKNAIDCKKIDERDNKKKSLKRKNKKVGQLTKAIKIDIENEIETMLIERKTKFSRSELSERARVACANYARRFIGLFIPCERS